LTFILVLPLEATWQSDLGSWILNFTEDSLGELEKKCNEAEEIANINMGARKQHSSTNFHGGLIEGISLILIVMYMISTLLFLVMRKAS